MKRTTTNRQQAHLPCLSILTVKLSPSKGNCDFFCSKETWKEAGEAQEPSDSDFGDSRVWIGVPSASACKEVRWEMTSKPGGQKAWQPQLLVSRALEEVSRKTLQPESNLQSEEFL